MVSDSFIKAYRKFLKDSFSAERAEKEKAYLYSDLEHYGVSVPKRESFLKQYKKELAALPKKEAWELAKYLWKQPSFEERAVALFVMELHLNEMDKSDMPLIEKMMRECKGWALLDSLIIPFMPTILSKDQSVYAYLKKWIGDDDFWVRRSALLAQLLFFRKETGGDRELFFEMAKSQFDESWINNVYSDTQTRSRAKFFIRKAIGWTLREMSLKNPQVVVDFLNKNKGKMASFIYREGSRRLPDTYKDKLDGKK